MSDSLRRPPSHAGCRVAVFHTNAVSGATLGYYGTLIGSDGQGVYVVHVPAFGRTILVAHRDLLVLEHTEEGERLVPPEDGDAWQLANWPWEIEFETAPGADNSLLRGKYRIGMIEKGRFEFVKVDRSLPSYMLRIPAKSLGSSRGKLKYNVPADRVLDRAYVMKTLAAILAVSLPSKDGAATA